MEEITKSSDKRVQRVFHGTAGKTTPLHLPFPSFSSDLLLFMG